MTTTQLQLRRDTTANINGITPAQGEPIYDVTRKALVLGDGATIGGNCITPFGGTWTPTLGGSSTDPTVTYATQSGVYAQIGNVIIASGLLAVSSISGGSGSVTINGLPAACLDENGAGMIAGLGGFTFQSASYTQCNLSPAGVQIFFEESGSGVVGHQSLVSQIGASFTTRFTVIYLAAQPTG